MHRRLHDSALAPEPGRGRPEPGLEHPVEMGGILEAETVDDLCHRIVVKRFVRQGIAAGVQSNSYFINNIIRLAIAASRRG